MPENNPRHVKTFYILDLDRTLFDTVAAANAWVDLIEAEDPALAAYIHQQIDDTLLTTTSFSIRESIVEKGGESLALKIDEAFVEYGKLHNLRHEGADALVEFAQQGDDSGVGILTFGNPEGQKLKVRVAGYDTVPVLATYEKHKGTLISGWYYDGAYHLPDAFGSVTADSIVFVDDREFSFEGIREDVIGYWLTSDISVLDEVGYPLNVTPVTRLTAVIEAEQERLGL